MKSPILSICIPTFNRNLHLDNCLNSIKIASEHYSIDFEVCVSDNYSSENPIEIIEKYKNFFKINFNQNKSNEGLGANILKSVDLASGEFVWIIGNDDLLLPKTFKKLELFLNKKEIDFFLINSFHLNVDHILQSPHPFNTYNLPNKMNTFSSYKKDKRCKFFELINPLISFDFMLGMFLSIFRRKIWVKNLNTINQNNLYDLNTYSNFDNTAPHVKIFSSGFLNKNAYFVSEGLSVNLSGVREWSAYYPFVESFRIPDVLMYYKKNGLSLLRYFYCMSFANRKFIINLFKILFIKKYKGKSYLNFTKDILPKFFYLSSYAGFLFNCFRKLFKIVFLR